MSRSLPPAPPGGNHAELAVFILRSIVRTGGTPETAAGIVEQIPAFMLAQYADMAHAVDLADYDMKRLRERTARLYRWALLSPLLLLTSALWQFAPGFVPSPWQIVGSVGINGAIIYGLIATWRSR